jgi:BirA family biotin operon repressor/biotin-[acetyl-CoA-carboxylase] ligase
MIPGDAALLVALRSDPVHLPASELGRQLGLTPSALEARIRGLRVAGFDIEERPGFGYRLLSSPDRLIADDLWARLASADAEPETGAFLREILVFEETGSTNDLAEGLGRQGVAGGVAIFAERQTAGRGRFGRRWESAAHRGLWFSLLLRPALPFAQWARLTTWAGAAVAAALEECAACRAAIKWPNDVLLDGKKAAGILIEAGTDTDSQPFAVVGIGINANQQTEEFPPELGQSAISLRMASGRDVERPALAATVLHALAARSSLVESDFDQLLREATDRSALLGRWIRVQTGSGAAEGVAEALNPDGHLQLRTADGTLQTLSAGEVTLRAE